MSRKWSGDKGWGAATLDTGIREGLSDTRYLSPGLNEATEATQTPRRTLQTDQPVQSLRSQPVGLFENSKEARVSEVGRVRGEVAGGGIREMTKRPGGARPCRARLKVKFYSKKLSEF